MTRKSSDTPTDAMSEPGTGREGSEGAYPLRAPHEPRYPFRFLVAAAVLGCVVGALFALAVRLAPLVPLVLVGGAVAGILALIHIRRELAVLREEARRVPQLVLSPRALAYVDGDEKSNILTLDRRFGLTLLASPARRDLVLAITHRDGIEYLGARSPSGARHVELLSRAITTPENDLPIGDRVPMFEDGDGLLDLVAALEVRDPGALDRVYLSDAGMADIVLDDRRLRAGQLDFDLRLPLAWRAFNFQEGSTFASHTFQATHIRQGEREVVLVSLAPTGEIVTPSVSAPPPGMSHQGPLAETEVQKSLARDLRLAHSLADLPPSRAHRVAIDRLFMPRLRLALDAAPAIPVEVIVPARTSAPEIMTSPDGLEQLRQSSPDVR